MRPVGPLERVQRRLGQRVRRRVGSPDQGRAIIEFLVVGLLILLPVTYLVTTLARVQAAAFAVSTASREAGRAFTTAAADPAAYSRAQAAAALSFEDFDFGGAGTVQISCDGSPCLRPQGRVQVEATVVVPLPLVPDLLRAAFPAQVPVSATHIATVDRFRG